MFVGGWVCIKLSNLDSVVEDLTKRGQILQKIKGNLKYFYI